VQRVEAQRLVEIDAARNSRLIGQTLPRLW